MADSIVKKPLKIFGVGLLAILLLGLYLAPARVTRETAPRKYPNRIPVRFWHMWSAEWKDVVDHIVDQYNESQDKYEVIALSIPGSSGDTKFMLGALGGDPPDVMAQWNPVIPTWAEGGLLTPYEDLMSPAEYAQFQSDAYPVVKRIGEYKGKTYGIPIGVNVKAVFYLPDEFRKAGIDTFPGTWEELVADSSKLTQHDAKGEISRLGFLPGTWADTAALFGGGFYDFKNDRLTLDSAANLRCLESLVALRKRDGYNEVQRFQSGLNTLSFGGGWPFNSRDYAAVIDGQWRVQQIAKYAPTMNYATAPIPAPVGGTPGAGLSNGNFMLIPRSAKEKAGAWDFVKFWSGLSDPARAAQFYVDGGWLPLSDKIANAPVYRKYIHDHPQFQTFVDAVRNPNLRAQPPVAFQVFINDTVTKEEDLALRGDVSPQSAVKQLSDAVTKEIARRKELGYDE
jgi:multiple sugar transport system substrate-binding protein